MTSTLLCAFSTFAVLLLEISTPCAVLAHQIRAKLHAIFSCVRDIVEARDYGNAVKLQSDWCRPVQGAGTTPYIASHQTLSPRVYRSGSVRLISLLHEAVGNTGN